MGCFASKPEAPAPPFPDTKEDWVLAMKGRSSLTYSSGKDTLAPGAAPWVGEALAHNTSLGILNLNEVKQFGDEGAAAVAKALKTNKKLKECYLGSTGMGDEGAKALAEALKVNNTLQVLNIAVNRIGDAGALALAEALKVNKTVKLLSLVMCPVGEAGVEALEGCRTAERRIKLDLFDQ